MGFPREALAACYGTPGRRTGTATNTVRERRGPNQRRPPHSGMKGTSAACAARSMWVMIQVTCTWPGPNGHGLLMPQKAAWPIGHGSFRWPAFSSLETSWALLPPFRAADAQQNNKKGTNSFRTHILYRFLVPSSPQVCAPRPVFLRPQSSTSFKPSSGETTSTGQAFDLAQSAAVR